MEALASLVVWLALLDGTAHTVALTPPPPTLADCRRFPDHVTARMLATRAREHWDRCQPLYGTAAERDAYRVWYILDDVMLASDPERPEEARLEVLRRLREWLGEDGWHAGALPPPVPMWAAAN